MDAKPAREPVHGAGNQHLSDDETSERELRRRVQQESEKLREVDLGSLLDGLGVAAPVVQRREFGYLHECAALLSTFSIGELPLTEKDFETDTLDKLLNDCSIVREVDSESTSSIAGRWRLDFTIRRDVLSRMGSRKHLLKRLRDIPRRRMDLHQQIFEELISGDSQVMTLRDDLNWLAACIDVLAAVSEIDGSWSPEAATEWRRCIARLPAQHEIRDRLNREILLEPLKKLVGDNFRGRRKELQELTNYVGVLSTDIIETSLRVFRKIFDLVKEPPLMIFGPGGMGKSTLIAKFILDHASSSPKLPFVYIDLDRAAFIPFSALNFYQEILRQLRVQFPKQTELFDKLRDSLNAQAGSTANLISNSRQLDESKRISFANEFALVYRQLDMGELPLLLVLDTFERVQLTSKAHVEYIFEILAQLQAVVPNLRCVLAGRSPITQFKTRAIELSQLDLDTAQSMLEARGIPEQYSKAIARQVQGNPLSLKLAVQLYNAEGAGREGIRDLPTNFLFKFKESRIQSQLYARLLRQIHNPNVRKIAHPGLVLRRLTPEIILNVLADPCGLSIRNIGQAKALFAELKQEITLVEIEPDGALRHRPDVRAFMLQLLKEDQPRRVKDINMRAVDYYLEHGGADSAARAEEIYHRLLLEQDRTEIESRWLPGVETYFNAQTLEELGTSGKTFLASRLGYELPEDVWRNADLADWERTAARNCRSLLDLRQPEKAIALLRQRKERVSNSELFLLEVDILIALRHWDLALATAEAAIKQVREGDDDYLLLELLSRAVQLKIKRLQFLEAFRAYEEAKGIARIRRKKLDLAELQYEWLPSQLDLLRYYASSLADYTLEFRDEIPSEFHHRFAHLVVAQAAVEKKLGDLEASKANLRLALEHYGDALLLVPSDLESWYGKGNAFLAIGDRLAAQDENEASIQSYISAIECFETGLSRFEDDVECNNNKALSLWSIADVFKHVGQADDAFRYYTKAISLLERLRNAAPDDHIILCNLGQAYYDLGDLGSKLSKTDEYAQAIVCFDQALKINPYDRLSWFNKGNAFNSIGERLESKGDYKLAYTKYEAAVASYDMAIVEKEPDADVWSNKGNALRSLAGLAAKFRSVDTAISFLTKAKVAFDNAADDAAMVGDSYIEPLVDAFGCFVIRTHLLYQQRVHTDEERLAIMRTLLERLSGILFSDVSEEDLIKIVGQQLEIITYYCPDLLTMHDSDKHKLSFDVLRASSSMPSLRTKVLDKLEVLLNKRIDGLKHYQDLIVNYSRLLFGDGRMLF